LWSLLHSSFSSLLGPKIHLRILFSNTLSLHSSLNVRDHASQPYSTDIRTILDLEEVGINTRKWTDLAQDRDYWRALVNAALYLRVP
jgi:hypothetical protein